MVRLKYKCRLLLQNIKGEDNVLEINQKGTIMTEVPQEELFTQRRITSITVYEQDHVEITFVDSGKKGEKYQTINAPFADYQKYLEHPICTLIDGNMGGEEAE